MGAAFWFCFMASLISVIAVNHPTHNCHNYFTYFTPNGGATFIGVFTAHRNDLRTFYWEAKFTAHGVNVDQVDYLNPYPSNEECYANVRKGLAAQMYVNFFNITNELPMLTEFKLNGVMLCRNQKYHPPTTTTRVARRLTVDEIRRAWVYRKNS
ncbi:uncharacterized protein LOC108032152 [Drosophila biarmipes]|uniref:uncharacterized protein LOC108032152 n=1 Tax=Drosophila biarmipes TaxID=125945 RepID=UPI001CDB03C7|nr:uncharacterized protein LOC108032152 [Drosophila biarmipes]